MNCPQIIRGGDLPSVQNEISKDIQVQSLRAQLNQEDSIISQLQGFGPSYRPLISAKAAREDMQRRLDDAIAERRAQVTATIIEGLRQNKEQTDSQMKAIAEKVGKGYAEKT